MEFRRIYWQCRRGLLELDLLLIPFLEKFYPHLTRDEQKQFKAMLAHPDPELLEWCLGSTLPPEALVGIVRKVQECAKTRR